MPSIRSLKREHPHLFCPQDWYEYEPFVDDPAGTYQWTMPTGLMPRTIRCSVQEGSRAPCADDHCRCRYLPRAVNLVMLYVMHPSDPTWRDYLWTSSFDREGQRVYVGGVANGRGFEIHRHLRLTERWGVPVWDT